MNTSILAMRSGWNFNCDHNTCTIYTTKRHRIVYCISMQIGMNLSQPLKEFVQKLWNLNSGMKPVTVKPLFSLSHWIIQSTHLFKNTDSFRNSTISYNGYYLKWLEVHNNGYKEQMWRQGCRKVYLHPWDREENVMRRKGGS